MWSSKQRSTGFASFRARLRMPPLSHMARSRALTRRLRAILRRLRDFRCIPLEEAKELTSRHFHAAVVRAATLSQLKSPLTAPKSNPNEVMDLEILTTSSAARPSAAMERRDEGQAPRRLSLSLVETTSPIPPTGHPGLGQIVSPCQPLQVRRSTRISSIWIRRNPPNPST